MNVSRSSCIPCPVRLADLARQYDELVELLLLQGQDVSLDVEDPDFVARRLVEQVQTLQLLVRLLQSQELNLPQKSILDSTLRRSKLLIRFLQIGTVGNGDDDDDEKFALKVTNLSEEGGADTLLEWKFVQKNILQNLDQDQLLDEEECLFRMIDTPIPPEYVTVSTHDVRRLQQQQWSDTIQREWGC